MATNWVNTVTGHLPSIVPTTEDEDSPKDLTPYLPVAVLAYIGYLVGFETGVDIPIPTTEVVLTATYYDLTVKGTLALMFAVHLTNWSHGGLTTVLLLAVLVGLTYVSVLGILATKLYARSIIGLVLSSAQFLVIANFLTDIAATLVYWLVIDTVSDYWHRLLRWWSME